MTETSPVAARRRALWQRLLPDGAPTLWCPLLTHFDDGGRLDAARTARQLDTLRPHVGGLLLAGSTGDGWTLSPDERQQLFDTVLPLAHERGFASLLGVLDPTEAGMRSGIERTLAGLQAATGCDDVADAMARRGVVGLTLCAPHGAALTRDTIGGALDRLLAPGAPVSLYQLPQVTGNEIAPATLDALAARHPNLLMLKDTSGADRIADAGGPACGALFLVRGAEGRYAAHLKAGGGRYDGLLLSSANGLGAPLARLVDLLGQARHGDAQALSDRLGAAVAAVFEAAAAVPGGNAFTNANKAIDHWMAHGPRAAAAAPPRLHGGGRLPADFVALAGDLLQRHGFAPSRGYLD